MTTYINQEFRSSDLNSPPLTGQVNSVPTLFTMCLINGYNFNVTITSITRSGTTATATVSPTDGLKLKTGQILTVSGVTAGADGTLYNITATITVASTTTFTYTMAGTPSGSATGSPVASSLLPITSITRGGSGNLTATATLTNVNTTLRALDYINVGGCSSTGAAQYNGMQQILTISTTSGVTTFTYLMASDPGANASGTPTYFKSGLQWITAAVAGTNAQSYTSQDTSGAIGDTYTPRPFQIVDNGATTGGAKEAQIWGYETITSDQTGTGLFPTTVQLSTGAFIRKSSTADTTVRAWTLAGNSRGFYFNTVTGDAAIGFGLYYGYVIPHHSGDAYNTVLAACFTTNSAIGTDGAHFVGTIGVTPAQATHGAWMPRLYSQAGSAVAAVFVGIGAGAAMGSANGGGVLSYPHASDNALYTQRIYVGDANGNIRGRLPGIHAPLHVIPMVHYDVSTNNAGLAGVTLRAVSAASANIQGQLFYDINGPWN